MATAEKYSCCATLGVSVPGVVMVPKFRLAPRAGHISGSFAALSRAAHLLRQRDALAAAGRVVDQNRLRAGSLGVIEHQRRPDLADRCGAVALVAGELQDRRFVEVVAGEMLIDVGEDWIALEKRRQAVAGARHFEAGIDGIGEIAGVAEHMPGGHRRRVRRGESRKQRVAVAQAYAVARDRSHGRGRGVVDHAGTQAVGDEQHHVMRPLGRRLRQGCWRQSLRCRDACHNGRDDKGPVHWNVLPEVDDNLPRQRRSCLGRMTWM